MGRTLRYDLTLKDQAISTQHFGNLSASPSPQCLSNPRDHGPKGFYVADRELAQGAAIHRNVKFFDTVNEPVVGNAARPASRIYPNYPQLAHVGLFALPIAIRKPPRAPQRILGVFEQTRPIPEIAARCRQNPTATLFRRHRSCYPWHVYVPVFYRSTSFADAAIFNKIRYNPTAIHFMTRDAIPRARILSLPADRFCLVVLWRKRWLVPGER
jgi:hypothetical protein